MAELTLPHQVSRETQESALPFHAPVIIAVAVACHLASDKKRILRMALDDGLSASHHPVQYESTPRG